MKIKTLVLFVVFLSFGIQNISYSQLFKEYFVGFGIITTNILGDNPAKNDIVSSFVDATQVLGGGFNLTQSGMEARLTLPLNSNFNIPFQIDYTFFSTKELSTVGYEEISGADTISVLDIHKYHNKLNIFGISTGLHYIFKELPIANAKFYTGLELKANYIHSYDFKHRIENLTFPERSENKKYDKKDDVFRLGAVYRLGVYGRLHNDWDVNISGSVSALNLLGRDDSRGELLTPFSLFTRQESIVYNIHFSMLIQYRFNQPKPVVIEVEE